MDSGWGYMCDACSFIYDCGDVDEQYYNDCIVELNTCVDCCMCGMCLCLLVFPCVFFFFVWV